MSDNAHVSAKFDPGDVVVVVRNDPQYEREQLIVTVIERCEDGEYVCSVSDSTCTYEPIQKVPESDVEDVFQPPLDKFENVTVLRTRR